MTGHSFEEITRSKPERSLTEAIRKTGGRNNQGVITEAAKKKIVNVDGFEKVLDQNRGKSIGLTVKDSNGDSRFFALKVPNN